MLAILSPAKKQDFAEAAPFKTHSLPHFSKEVAALVKCLRDYDAAAISQLMGVSKALGELNAERYQQFAAEFTLANSKQAAFALKGDTYQGLEADMLTEKDLEYAQDHLLILSGLYGALKPLDLIQPYRLEMKTALQNPVGKNLYAFWGSKITDAINAQLAASNSEFVVNLASNEYFKAIQPKALQGTLIAVDFKENKDGKLKTIGLFAKRARGMMARHIITNRVEDLVGLHRFNDGGYSLDESLSTEHHLVFVR